MSSKLGTVCRLGLAALMLAWLVSGCGGGKSGTTGGAGGTSLLPDPTGGATSRDGSGTARFYVDLAGGKVDVTPLEATGANGRAVFTGSAVTFNSQLVLDQPGATGLRVLNVSLTNHWALPIGQAPDGTVTGLRVLFGPFTNLTAVPDVRPQVAVSTLPGTVPNPFGVAVASDGTVFATSLSSYSVMQLSGGKVTRLAGSGTTGAADGLGAGASFGYPLGMAVSPADGAIYLADYNSARIRRIDRNGRVVTIAGTGTKSSLDGPGTSATFRSPFGVAAVSSGDLFVTDWDAGTVRRLHPSGDPAQPANWTVSTVVSGLLGAAGIAAGGDGLVYVAEANANRIRQVSPTGSWTVVAGGGAEGATDGGGDTAQFAIPYGLAWTPNGLVVSEFHSPRLRWVRLLPGGAPTDPASWQVLTLAGTASTVGTADGDGTSARFNTLKLLSADAGGAVYVADAANNAIRKLILPSATGLQGGGTTGSTEPVALSNADGVLPGANGTTVPFINYQWYDLATPRSGSRSVLNAGQTSPVKTWAFTVPEGVTAFTFTVTVEAATPVLVPPEAGNGVGSSRVMVSTLAGSLTGGTGYQDGAAPVARFAYALAAADAYGNVYLADANNQRIRRIGLDGTVSTVAGTGTIGGADGTGNVATFSAPVYPAVSADGTVLYVASSNTVRRLVLTPGADPRLSTSWTVSTIAGQYGTAAYTNGLGSAARFNQPVAVAAVSNSLVYVSEFAGNRVRRLVLLGGDPMVADNWKVDLLAGSEAGAVGDAGTADGTGNAARFSNPRGLAADRAGNLYLADLANDRIRKLTPDGVVTTFAGPSGVTILAAYVDGSAANARFDAPQSVAVDPSGYLYVADANNHRIRRISPSGTVSTIAGTGVAGAADGPGLTATLDTPRSVCVNGSGDLIITDGSSTERVRKLSRVISAGTQ